MKRCQVCTSRSPTFRICSPETRPAREAGESGDAARESGEEAAGFFEMLNPFRKKASARESGQNYNVRTSSQLTRSRDNVATPSPGSMPRDGDFGKAALTMDDVKKLLHPEAFD